MEGRGPPRRECRRCLEPGAWLSKLHDPPNSPNSLLDSTTTLPHAQPATARTTAAPSPSKLQPAAPCDRHKGPPREQGRWLPSPTPPAGHSLTSLEHGPLNTDATAPGSSTVEIDGGMASGEVVQVRFRHHTGDIGPVPIQDSQLIQQIKEQLLAEWPKGASGMALAACSTGIMKAGWLHGGCQGPGEVGGWVELEV